MEKTLSCVSVLAETRRHASSRPGPHMRCSSSGPKTTPPGQSQVARGAGGRSCPGGNARGSSHVCRRNHLASSTHAAPQRPEGRVGGVEPWIRVVGLSPVRLLCSAVANVGASSPTVENSSVQWAQRFRPYMCIASGRYAYTHTHLVVWHEKETLTCQCLDVWRPPFGMEGSCSASQERGGPSVLVSGGADHSSQ